ncbi:hypothetical protein BCON_0082g00420 [Botryotinia convoluta]|uniref:Uncharacterized protein n=1 Tax=Botryotinia convoluta TaxID=54673 RepID=A0A4Z1I389_9HELO|nr:hypothetical protein BCON_0082g00420 [Botryotinia convoluta]
MPNWKSYEATVRLLSAIVAAHPTLRLDYAAISVRFGGDCTASALDNRFRRLKSDAKLINAAVAKGEDPILMNVGDTNGEIACKGKGGNKFMLFSRLSSSISQEHRSVPFAYTNAALAISELMGSATPASHIQSQLRETIKPLGERLIAMRDAGEDCKDVDMTDLGTRRYKAEIAAKMGSNVTPISVKAQFSRSFRVLAARQNALCAVGKDLKDASLDKLGSQQKSEVAKYMGSDVTPTTIKIQYNATIKTLSRRQIALFDAGKDPLDVSLNNPKGETARIMGSDTTPSSLQNHFRRTVKVLGNRQMSMLAAEIVEIMGSDVTVEVKQQIGKRIKVLGSRQTKMRTAEMDKFMGDSTVNGLRFQFDTRYKVIAKRQKAMLAAGRNPSTVDIVTGGKTEVQKCFGSDATPGRIKFQFATTIKKNVDQIRSARAAGKDCKDITFNSNGLLIYIFHCEH